MKLFPFHLHLTDTINNKFAENSIKEVIILEQMIMSGVDQLG